MNAGDWVGFFEAARRRLIARVDLADADYVETVESELEARTLQAYAQALKDVPEPARLAWLTARVAHLEARVEALTRALAAPAPPPEPDHAVVWMDERVVQEGFHLLERNGAGVAYRWLGPEPQARVYLPKVRGPVEATLVVEGLYKRVDPRALRVALNGGPWRPLEAAPAGGELRLVARPLEGPDAGGALHRLDIDCGATFSPAEEGHPDTRKLGIAISRVEIAALR